MFGMSPNGRSTGSMDFKNRSLTNKFLTFLCASDFLLMKSIAIRYSVGPSPDDPDKLKMLLS